MTLFPNKLNDEYKGSTLAIYGLYPVFALYIFRSLVHFLSENAGLVGIATIKELPIIDTIDPNNLVYLFASLWGATQVSLTLVLLILKNRLCILLVLFDAKHIALSGILYTSSKLNAGELNFLSLFL